MALPHYIGPGLYFKNLNGVINRATQACPTSDRNHPKVHGILGKEGTAALITMSKYKCQFELKGHKFNVPTLNITHEAAAEGIYDDFVFIRQQPNAVTLGYLDLPIKTNTHVLSDGFLGCEWHILSHIEQRALAFLHVYRDGSRLYDYVYAGWEKKAVLSSSSLIAEMRQVEMSTIEYSIAAYAFINARTSAIDTCLLVLNNRNGQVVTYKQDTEITLDNSSWHI